MATMLKEIVQATLRLLRVKRFEYISVNDICKEASVSRSTFYRNFKDKYDVIRNILPVLMDERLKPSVTVNLKDKLFFLLEILKENQKAFLNIFHYHGPDSFQDYLFNYLLCLFQANPSQRHDSEFIFNIAGTEKLILVWLEKDCQIPVEKLVSNIWEMLSIPQYTDQFVEGNGFLKKKQEIEVVLEKPITSEQQKVLNVFIEFCRGLVHRNITAMKSAAGTSMKYLLPDGQKETICTFYENFQKKNYQFFSIRLQQPQISIEDNMAEIRLEKLELFGFIENQNGVFEDSRTFLVERDKENQWKLTYSYPILP